MKLAAYTIGSVSVVGLFVGAFFLPNKYQSYDSGSQIGAVASSTVPEVIELPSGPPPFVVTHIETPSEVKALYMSSWVAGSTTQTKSAPLQAPFNLNIYI